MMVAVVDAARRIGDEVDVEELDQWLDDDGVVGRDGAGRRSPDADGGRRPWRWIAMTGAVVWAAVMAVVLLGGDDAVPLDQAAPEVSDLLEPAEAHPTAPDTMAPDTRAPDTRAPDTTAPDTSASAAAADDPPPTVEATAPAPQGTVGAGGWPPGIEAGAVRALRHHLTVAGPPATYLEWATPVAARAMDAGIWVVELEAVWLQDDEGRLDRATTGTWAVALGDDGQQLAPPWPLAAAAAPAAALEPPTGTSRLAEVQQGLTAAGWHEVTAVAADAHPLLAGVVVALVEGTPPTGDATTGAILWLAPTAEGILAPLAVRS